MKDSAKAVTPPHGRFSLGSLAATPKVLALLERLGVSPLTLVLRHVTGDFGELDAADVAANEEAIEHGLRVFSAYAVNDPHDTAQVNRVWIITEADRSVTTVLTPAEY
ncbi:hypothetical protein J7U46_08840 [Pelomonas sp. V22]|uniref:hypothetical protein n=1 Tax=Pelomonas sp. V22 TaxID=2822139 RepID=UPI0024A94407|nr:hypothetical protein [Pelomonas sp. V22]MDI4633150.1 hypothetical protein [Pelomonas sp. V22]